MASKGRRGTVWVEGKDVVDTVSKHNQAIQKYAQKVAQYIPSSSPADWETFKSVFVADDKKYNVVDAVTNEIQKIMSTGKLIAQNKISSISTINGVRFQLENGSWGLIRASSNKPSLVIVIESFISSDELKMIFDSINEILEKTGEVGEYDQSLGI